ncbi:MAG: hypothetical protein JNL50_12310 [Phycisphaerae bacterium]|nr:hypothetical protein [Phycisphaerae bacterium]
MVYEQNGSLVVAFTPADPNWSVAESLTNSPGIRVFKVFVPGRKDSPFAPGVIVERTPTDISAYSSPGSVLASWDDLARIHEALYQWSLNTNHVGMISNPRAVARISWPGIAFNVLLLLLVLTVPLALARFVLETRAAARERVWIERLQRGVCPRCEYSIAGLQLEACPECGEFVPRDAIAAANARANEVGGDANGT